MIKVTEVILTDLELRGSGKVFTSPCRRVLQVYDLDGNLIADRDSLVGQFVKAVLELKSLKEGQVSDMRSIVEMAEDLSKYF